MRRLVTGVMLVVVLATALALAHDLVWHPMIMMHRAGVAGLFAEQGRQCDVPPYEQWHACAARLPWTPSVDEQESVLMARGTRQITQVMHWWETRDSATWSHLRDSIVTALDDRGGHRTPCSPPYDPSRNLAWRFADNDVLLSTVRLPGPEGQPPRWSTLVQSTPVGLWCSASPDERRRWLTAGEIGEHLWRWVAERSD